MQTIQQRECQSMGKEFIESSDDTKCSIKRDQSPGMFCFLFISLTISVKGDKNLIDRLLKFSVKDHMLIYKSGDAVRRDVDGGNALAATTLILHTLNSIKAKTDRYNAKLLIYSLTPKEKDRKLKIIKQLD